MESILLGVVQGATEFLPISSSGHLFLLETWLGLTPDLNLTILTHIASLGAVLVVFWKQVWELVLGFVSLIIGKELVVGSSELGQTALKLGVATVLTVLVALIIEPWFGELLNLTVVSVTLIITGLLIVISEKFRRGEGTELTWTITVWLGLVQGMAVVPGISRSGLTIAFLILLGLNRRKAAEYSFLLSIPTILAAGVFLVLDSDTQFALTSELLLACLASFVTALIMIYSMLKLVEKHWLWFAPYCIGLGVLLQVL